MLDTDYPNPPSEPPDAPLAAATPIANLTGLAHCFLALSAKKRARDFAAPLFSRSKMIRRTQVRAQCDLSRGDSAGEVLG